MTEAGILTEVISEQSLKASAAIFLTAIPAMVSGISIAPTASVSQSVIVTPFLPKFVISNDTGPAHMTAHLNVKGLALFGSHTTAKKVSIERENFKPIQVSDLSKLSADKVFLRMQELIK